MNDLKSELIPLPCLSYRCPTNELVAAPKLITKLNLTGMKETLDNKMELDLNAENAFHLYKTCTWWGMMNLSEQVFGYMLYESDGNGHQK